MEYMNEKQIKKVYQYDLRLSEFRGRVPAKIKHLTLYYMDYYYVSLNDAFEWAVKEHARKNSELWAAWYWSDFRAFIPGAYRPQFLDFEKYPLSYKKIRPGVWGLNPAAVKDYV